MSDKTMSFGIDILRVLGVDKYHKLCATEGASRMYDVRDDLVLKWRDEYCSITRERAKALIDRVSAFNQAHPSRQIQCRYDVDNGIVTMVVNGDKYANNQFADVCYHVQRLGVKMPLVFSDIVEV